METLMDEEEIVRGAQAIGWALRILTGFALVALVALGVWSWRRG
jgi:hypothetical protein